MVGCYVGNVLEGDEIESTASRVVGGDASSERTNSLQLRRLHRMVKNCYIQREVFFTDLIGEVGAHCPIISVKISLEL